MLVCYDCGVHINCREEDGKIFVYDIEKRAWISECPYCESHDFYEEGEDYNIELIECEAV